MSFLFVNSADTFNDFFNSYYQKTTMAVDTETTGLLLFSDKIRLFQVYAKGCTPAVLDFRYISQFRDKLELFLSKNRTYALHNASFDLKFLWAMGLNLKGFIFDTMLAAQSLDAGLDVKYSLKECAARYINVELDKFEQKTDYSGNLTPEQIRYAADDARYTYQLYEVLNTSIMRRRLMGTLRIEARAIRPIAAMEYNGFGFDKEQWNLALEAAKNDAEKALNELTLACPKQNVGLSLFGGVNINFNSPQAVLTYFKGLGIKIDSLNQKSITDLAKKNKLIALYAAWKKQDTRWRDFVKYLKHINPATGRLHSSFLQNQAETGRMTSRNPNLQNIPREAVYRRCFVPKQGNKLVVADFSQIELRVLAEVTGDRRMLQAYNNDEDLHTITAAALNDIDISQVTKAMRTEAKPVNFGLIFGSGPDGLLRQAKYGYGLDVDLDWATEKRAKFMQTYVSVPKWHRELSNETGDMITTITGRQRWLTMFTDRLTVRANTRIQGPAADITKLALGLLWDAYEKDPYFLFISVVHDEIILECSEDRASELALTLKSCMETAGSMVMKRVKTVADTAIGNNWSECK